MCSSTFSQFLTFHPLKNDGVIYGQPACIWSSRCELWNSHVSNHFFNSSLYFSSPRKSEIMKKWSWTKNYECNVLYLLLPLNNSRELCFLFSGECKCLAGFKGRHCEMPCDRGRYGIGCSYRCNCVHANSDGCDPISGKCLCKPGWKGKFRVK